MSDPVIPRFEQVRRRATPFGKFVIDKMREQHLTMTGLQAHIGPSMAHHDRVRRLLTQETPLSVYEFVRVADYIHVDILTLLAYWIALPTDHPLRLLRSDHPGQEQQELLTLLTSLLFRLDATNFGTVLDLTRSLLLKQEMPPRRYKSPYSAQQRLFHPAHKGRVAE